MSETVILLHGLARSYRCMRKMDNALRQAGYDTLNINYASTRDNIETLSETVISNALSQTSTADTVHFVTHSLGGVLLRYYLKHRQIDKLGRVVMLAPPNQGSEVAGWLQHLRLFRKLMGPAAVQLSGKASDLISQLGPAEFELGIIAGNRPFNPLFAPFLAKPNDGTVTVENTRLAGMKDHITLPASHPFIMRHNEVIRQVLYFLQQGQFDHDGNPQ